MPEKTFVVITTEWRGIFFGELKSYDAGSRIAELRNARNCIWFESIGGFGGLASTGPNDKCRIGAPVDEQLFHGVTSKLICSEKAVEAWKNARTYGT